MLDRATTRLPHVPPRRAEVDDLPARVAGGWTRGQPGLRQAAYDAVNQTVPVTRWLYGSHGSDVAVDRWTYLRHYYMALSGLTDEAVDFDELLARVVREERIYLQRRRKAEDAAAQARRPGLQRDALLRWARKLPMNPVDNFEAGIVAYHVEAAAARPDFMDHGAHVEIDGHEVTLSYGGGRSLSFSSKILDFKGDDIRTAVASFVRRHRRSGRLVMFVVHQLDAPIYRDLPSIDALTRADRVYLGVPYLLTPVVHACFSRDPLYDAALGILGVLKVMSLGKGLPVGARLLSAGATTTARIGLGALGSGRAAVTEVAMAVTRYGFTGQAAIAIGRSAWVYYLSNAVSITTHVIVGTEVALSFTGQDMGPLSLGDSLVMASQLDDAVSAGRRTWQAVTAEVVEIEVASSVARLKVTKVEQIADDVAKLEFDLGKSVKATKPGASLAARGVDDTATGAKAIQTPRPPTVPPNAVAAGKNARKAPPSGSLGPPIVLEDLTRARDVMTANLARFPSLRTKFTPAAIDAIRAISADAIKAAGIRPQDLANLAKGLSLSGARVQRFINDYHAVPGFEQVLLNWAKRAYWSTKGKQPRWVESKASYFGTSYVMKYVTGKKLPPSQLRFEWPVSINDTRFGTEVTARWVDVVLGGDRLRPGTTIQIELKSWTEAWLRIKTRSPAGQSTQYPGTVGYQLIRDTALFTPENIRWVFDASKGVTKAEAVRLFERVIANDPYLAFQWGGKDRNPRLVRELLDRVIDVF